MAPELATRVSCMDLMAAAITGHLIHGGDPVPWAQPGQGNLEGWGEETDGSLLAIVAQIGFCGGPRHFHAGQKACGGASPLIGSSIRCCSCGRPRWLPLMKGGGCVLPLSLPSPGPLELGDTDLSPELAAARALPCGLDGLSTPCPAGRRGSRLTRGSSVFSR